MFLPFGNILTDVDKKEPLRASERTAGTSLPPSFAGSMTLEAALAVPLFVFFVMNLLFIFEAVRLQRSAGSASTGRRTSLRSGILYEIRAGSRGRQRRRIGRSKQRNCYVAARLRDLCEKQSDFLPGRILLEAFLCGWRKGRPVFCPVEDHDRGRPGRDHRKLQDQALCAHCGVSGFRDAGEILRSRLGGMDTRERHGRGQRRRK